MFQTAFQSNAFQNNAFQIAGIIPTIDTHDGFTKKEYKKWKEIQKKKALAEAQKIQAQLDKRARRKELIKDFVDPESRTVAKEQQNELESESEVQVGKPPIDLKKINADILHLEQQQQKLLKAVELRKQIAKKQAELAILEAKARAAEQDDEEALLAILFQTHI